MKQLLSLLLLLLFFVFAACNDEVATPSEGTSDGDDLNRDSSSISGAFGGAGGQGTYVFITNHSGIGNDHI